MTSCSKDEAEPKLDLADQVVGIYDGELAVTGVGKQDVKIRITKISSTVIQIQPFSGDESSTFGANLAEDVDGVVLNVPEIVVDGGTIRGNPALIEGYPGAHGVYETATKAFAYALKINIDGQDYDEVFIGVKK